MMCATWPTSCAAALLRAALTRLPAILPRRTVLLMNEGRTGFTPEQILHMDWLCDAVEGHLPEFDELIDCARPMYRMQGIHRDRLPAEKEADL